jgi:hypothetical protein
MTTSTILAPSVALLSVEEQRNNQMQLHNGASIVSGRMSGSSLVSSYRQRVLRKGGMKNRRVTESSKVRCINKTLPFCRTKEWEDRQRCEVRRFAISYE